LFKKLNGNGKYPFIRKNEYLYPEGTEINIFNEVIDPLLLPNNGAETLEFGGYTQTDTYLYAKINFKSEAHFNLTKLPVFILGSKPMIPDGDNVKLENIDFTGTIKAKIIEEENYILQDKNISFIEGKVNKSDLPFIINGVYYFESTERGSQNIIEASTKEDFLQQIKEAVNYTIQEIKNFKLEYTVNDNGFVKLKNFIPKNGTEDAKVIAVIYIDDFPKKRTLSFSAPKTITM